MPGVPFNTAAADVRSSTLGVLASWAGMVADEREVTAPARRVEKLAEFLYRHTDWLAGHPAAGDASGEFARLARAARRVAYPDHVRHIRLGECVESACVGELVAFLPTDADSANAVIRCEADTRHVWHGDRWTELRDRLATPPERTERVRWLSPAMISRLWGTTTGTVYRRASEQRWRRRYRAGRTYYHEQDVRRSFGR